MVFGKRNLHHAATVRLLHFDRDRLGDWDVKDTLPQGHIQPRAEGPRIEPGFVSTLIFVQLFAYDHWRAIGYFEEGNGRFDP